LATTDIAKGQAPRRSAHRGARLAAVGLGAAIASSGNGAGCASGAGHATIPAFNNADDHPMNADKLRSIQAPLKDRYRAEPGAALVTLKASGALDSASIACKVETGRALAAAGLHPATGGSGAELCSGDMLLEALVACAGVTLKAVATSIGVELRSGRVAAEGDIDFRGTLGLAKDAPVGFADIRLMFELDTDARQDQLDTLLKLTERYCVVLQTLKRPPAVETKLVRAKSS
jgi:uncharacterized OsmC-like protein